MTEIIDRTMKCDRKVYDRAAGYEIQFSINSDGRFVIRIYNTCIPLKDKDILLILNAEDTERLIEFCQAIKEVVL